MSWELPDRISVREVGPRDGLQNEDPVPTDAKVALLDALSATGVQRIEAVSFVRPSAIPQMADADEVWKRAARAPSVRDRKSTRLNSSHGYISYAVFCLKKKNVKQNTHR